LSDTVSAGRVIYFDSEEEFLYLFPRATTIRLIKNRIMVKNIVVLFMIASNF
jgi:hypothetical protein